MYHYSINIDNYKKWKMLFFSPNYWFPLSATNFFMWRMFTGIINRSPFKVFPEKHSLKMIKNYSVQVNWFVFLVRERCIKIWLYHSHGYQIIDVSKLMSTVNSMLMDTSKRWPLPQFAIPESIPVIRLKGRHCSKDTWF